MKRYCWWQMTPNRLLGLGASGLLVVLFLSLTLVMPGRASETPVEAETDAKRQDIRRLLALTGSLDMGMQMIDQMIETYRKQTPQVPSTFWNQFHKEIDISEMVERVVPIYDEHLTHEQIRAMIGFYSTPIGQEVVQAMPTIWQQTAETSQRWSQEIRARAMEKLRSSGQLPAPGGAHTQAGPEAL